MTVIRLIENQGCERRANISFMGNDGIGYRGVSYGIRTRVAAVKGRCPRPLDDGDLTFGGGKRDRTADLLHAMQALSQLSYTPESRALSGSPFSLSRGGDATF